MALTVSIAETSAPKRLEVTHPNYGVGYNAASVMRTRSWLRNEPAQQVSKRTDETNFSRVVDGVDIDRHGRRGPLSHRGLHLSAAQPEPDEAEDSRRAGHARGRSQRRRCIALCR